MKIVRELIKNYNATYLLKKRYYNITLMVGLLSVATGLGLMMSLVFYVGPMIGFDPDTKITANGVEKLGMFVLMMLFFTACIYAGMLIVAGSFAFVMFKIGKFTKVEAFNYALYSGYPEYWFEQKP